MPSYYVEHFVEASSIHLAVNSFSETDTEDVTVLLATSTLQSF